MEITQSINNENNPLRDLGDISLIVHHHTGSTGDSQNFLNRTDYVSCHYLIKKTGEIVHLMDDDRIAYHCGESKYAGFKQKGNSLNWCSIGIEVEGGGFGAQVNDFTDSQRNSLKWLTSHLKAKYGIEKVLRHKDIAPDRKVDPYDTLYNGDFNKFINNSIMTTDFIKLCEEYVGEDSIWNEGYRGDELLTVAQAMAMIDLACWKNRKKILEEINKK